MNYHTVQIAVERRRDRIGWVWYLDEHRWGGGWFQDEVFAQRRDAQASGRISATVMASVAALQLFATGRVQNSDQKLSVLTVPRLSIKLCDICEKGLQYWQRRNWAFRTGTRIPARRHIQALVRHVETANVSVTTGDVSPQAQKHARFIAEGGDVNECGPYAAWTNGGTLPSGEKVTFTDASVNPTARRGGWAVWCGEDKYRTGVVETADAHVAEGHAIAAALEEPGPLVVRSDAMSVLAAIERPKVSQRPHWADNPERTHMIRSVRSRLDGGKQLEWCAGHSGMWGNKQADRLAGEALAEVLAVAA